MVSGFYTQLLLMTTLMHQIWSSWQCGSDSWMITCMRTKILLGFIKHNIISYVKQRFQQQSFAKFQRLECLLLDSLIPELESLEDDKNYMNSTHDKIYVVKLSAWLGLYRTMMRKTSSVIVLTAVRNFRIRKRLKAIS